VCKCCCEGDAAAAAADAGGARAGQMQEQRSLALCSGGISHQASCISVTYNSIFMPCTCILLFAVMCGNTSNKPCDCRCMLA